jgi:hypothetical protein
MPRRSCRVLLAAVSALRRQDCQVAELKLVIFDCDGVLVDSEVISNRVLARALSAEGLPTTLQEARRDYQGLLLDDILVDVEARLARALPEIWLIGYERDRAEAFRRELQPVTGAGEVVERLIAAGARCASPRRESERRPACRWSSPTCGTCFPPARCSPPRGSSLASPIQTSSCTPPP